MTTCGIQMRPAVLRSIVHVFIFPLLAFLFSPILNAQAWEEVGGKNGLAGYTPIYLASNGTGTVYAAVTVYVGGNDLTRTFVSQWNENTNTWVEVGAANSFPKIYPIDWLSSDSYGNLYAHVNSWADKRWYVRKWNKDSNSWNELGGSNSLPSKIYPRLATVDTAGNVYVTYTDATIPMTHHILQWNKNNNSWIELTQSKFYMLQTGPFTSDASGNLYAAVGLTKGYNDHNFVGQLKNGETSWAILGDTNSLSINGVSLLTSDIAGNIYAVCEFKNNLGHFFIAKWYKRTNKWYEIGTKRPFIANGYINAITTDIFGNIYAAGRFTNDQGNFYIAEWIAKKDSWIEVGGDNSLIPNGWISSIASDAAGNIYVAVFDKEPPGSCRVVRFKRK